MVDVTQNRKWVDSPPKSPLLWRCDIEREGRGGRRGGDTQVGTPWTSCRNRDGEGLLQTISHRPGSLSLELGWSGWVFWCFDTSLRVNDLKSTVIVERRQRLRMQCPIFCGREKTVWRVFHITFRASIVQLKWLGSVWVIITILR